MRTECPLLVKSSVSVFNLWLLFLKDPSKSVLLLVMKDRCWTETVAIIVGFAKSNEFYQRIHTNEQSGYKVRVQTSLDYGILILIFLLTLRISRIKPWILYFGFLQKFNHRMIKGKKAWKLLTWAVGHQRIARSPMTLHFFLVDEQLTKNPLPIFSFIGSTIWNLKNLNIVFKSVHGL